MEKRYRLDLIGITYNQIESGVYAVILQQSGGKRRIPIIIGYPEAQAIECKLQEVAVPRPLTHDMMVNVISTFGISLKEVEIRKLSNGVFAADLYLSDGENTKVVDSRSSDAIALAIRVGAPIFTTESVLLEAGFDPESNSEGSVSEADDFNNGIELSDNSSALASYSLIRLEKEMLAAAENDDFEKAARLKAEIDRRKNEATE